MGSVTDVLPASPIASRTETTQHGMSAAPDAERLKFHPVADIFPLLEEPALSALAADIREHGLHDHIVLHPDDGSIVDGRNRYLACLYAGVKPGFRNWNGEGSLLAYVVSQNVHRRHLSESQRAIMAAEISTLRNGQRKAASPIGEAVTQEEAATLFNVGKRSVERARRVIDSGNTELIERVKKGESSVSKAAQAVRPRRTRKKPAATQPPAASTNLSRRWLEVKDLAEEGCSSRLIAAKLGLEHERLLKQAHSKGIEIRAEGVLRYLDRIAMSCGGDATQKIVVTDDEAVEIRNKIRTAEQWLQQLASNLGERPQQPHEEPKAAQGDKPEGGISA